MIRRLVPLRFALPVVLVILLVASVPALAFPPEKPYDPRPLTAEVEKKTSTDQYTFIVMGDVKGGGGFDPLVAKCDSLAPTFVILTGDMVASPGAKEYDRLEQQIGKFARKTPCWPCFGNHEGGGADALKYFTAFYGIDSRHFSFDFRNARFIGVDAPDHSVPGPAELELLEQQLAAGQKAGKLLFVWQHCPPYTVGSKSKAECPNEPTALTRLCQKYGVVAHFTGHDHIYYRTKRDGVNYIIQGVAGAGVYSLNRISEAIGDDISYGMVGQQAVLRGPAGEKTLPKPVFMLTLITVDGAKVTGKTMAADGQVYDEFTLHEGK